MSGQTNSDINQTNSSFKLNFKEKINVVGSEFVLKDVLHADSAPSPHLKASRVVSPFNVRSCLGPARQIGLRSSTALVSDKALDLRIINSIQ